jgi:hypothetical protein
MPIRSILEIDCPARALAILGYNEVIHSAYSRLPGNNINRQVHPKQVRTNAFNQRLPSLLNL